MWDTVIQIVIMVAAGWLIYRVAHRDGFRQGFMHGWRSGRLTSVRQVTKLQQLTLESAEKQQCMDSPEFELIDQTLEKVCDVLAYDTDADPDQYVQKHLKGAK